MMFSNEIAILFAVYFYVLKMADIRTLYSESVGVWWQARYLSVAEAVANLVMNYLFIKSMGVYGIILATLISYFVFNFIGGAIILFKHYFTGGGFVEYLLLNLKYIIITGIIAVVTYSLTSLLHLNGWLELIAKGVICVVVPGILYFIIYFKTKEFRDSKGLIYSILGKK